MTGWRKRDIANAIAQYAKDGYGENLRERVARALTPPQRKQEPVALPTGALIVFKREGRAIIALSRSDVAES